jgi:ribosomal protein L11 methyltransferase
MKWRRLTLRVDACDVEAASALLATATGAQVSVENDALVSAYVPQSRAASATRALSSALGRARRQGLLRLARRSSAIVRDEDWATSWKRFYRPSKLADGLYVVPSWHSGFRPPRGARTIQLDPGMAFGTGQHATTKMALQLLLPRVRASQPMLDIGCGSGILGMAAAQRGAKVFACDVDPIAVSAARDNFRVNGLRAAAVRRATGVPDSFPRAPLIAANITADVLAPLAVAFAKNLTREGAIVTSGVTKRGRTLMLNAFSDAKLRLVDERKSGEWLSFVHTKEG